MLGDRASAGVLAVITCYHDLDHAAAVPAVDPPLDRTRRGATGPQRVAGEVKAGQYARTVPEKGTAMGPASECGAVWLGPHPPSGVRTGFNFSIGFRRNFGVFFVFASYREEKFRYFSVFFVFKFKNSKIFIKNSKKI